MAGARLSAPGRVDVHADVARGRRAQLLRAQPRRAHLLQRRDGPSRRLPLVRARRSRVRGPRAAARRSRGGGLPRLPIPRLRPRRSLHRRRRRRLPRSRGAQRRHRPRDGVRSRGARSRALAAREQPGRRGPGVDVRGGAERPPAILVPRRRARPERRPDVLVPGRDARPRGQRESALGAGARARREPHHSAARRCLRRPLVRPPRVRARHHLRQQPGPLRGGRCHPERRPPHVPHHLRAECPGGDTGRCRSLRRAGGWLAAGGPLRCAVQLALGSAGWLRGQVHDRGGARPARPAAVGRHASAAGRAAVPEHPGRGDRPLPERLRHRDRGRRGGARERGSGARSGSRSELHQRLPSHRRSATAAPHALSGRRPAAARRSPGSRRRRDLPLGRVVRRERAGLDAAAAAVLPAPGAAVAAGSGQHRLYTGKRHRAARVPAGRTPGRGRDARVAAPRRSGDAPDRLRAASARTRSQRAADARGRDHARARRRRVAGGVVLPRALGWRAARGRPRQRNLRLVRAGVRPAAPGGGRDAAVARLAAGAGAARGHPDRSAPARRRPAARAAPLGPDRRGVVSGLPARVRRRARHRVCRRARRARRALHRDRLRRLPRGDRRQLRGAAAALRRVPPVAHRSGRAGERLRAGLAARRSLLQCGPALAARRPVRVGGALRRRRPVDRTAALFVDRTPYREDVEVRYQVVFFTPDGEVRASRTSAWLAL